MLSQQDQTHWCPPACLLRMSTACCELGIVHTPALQLSSKVCLQHWQCSRKASTFVARTQSLAVLPQGVHRLAGAPAGVAVSR